jgi:hypothetical protein
MGAPLSIRLPDETRKKMKELDINWPDYIRRAIEDKIRDAKRAKSAESMDKIRSKTQHDAFDSTKSIREDRNA